MDVMLGRALIEKHYVSYPEMFDLDLREDPFPWLLLSVLFGARISEKTAANTFRLFSYRHILSPDSILHTGWAGIVRLLDEGGYTRYDFKTATKLISMARNIRRYGSLNRLHEVSRDSDDLIIRLKGLATGIGDVTVGIFFREMVGVWEKSKPLPGPLPLKGAEMLSIDMPEYCRKTGIRYAVLESFLTFVGKGCLKGDCARCVAIPECSNFRNVV